MKLASRVSYLVGIIINVLWIVSSILVIVLAALAAFNGNLASQVAQDMDKTVEYVKGAGLVIFIFMIIEFLIMSFVLFVALRARKSLKENDGRVGSHVMMLIISIFGFDIFYFLGAIFGLIAAGQAKK